METDQVSNNVSEEPEAQTTQQPGAAENNGIDINALMKELKDVRKESASYRTKNKEISDQLLTKDNELASLHAANKATKIESEFIKMAQENGVADIKAASKLAKFELVEFDKDGAVDSKTLTTVLESLKTDHPILFTKTSQANIDASNKSKTNGQTMDDWIRSRKKI